MGSIDNVGSIYRADEVHGGETFEQTRALHCSGSGGLIYVDLAGGGENIPFYMAQGDTLAIQADKLYSTGLAATGIVACY